jgi:UDP-N-acetylglucosamine:LPS N-acetylglucosamine transferase
MRHSSMDGSRMTSVSWREKRKRPSTAASNANTDSSISMSNRRILVAASKGGHWDQMMILRNAFDGLQLTYVTTDKALLREPCALHGYSVPDCNRNRPLLILWCLLISVVIVLRVRPHYVLSTGALPGLFCVLAGRLVGAETIWVDSIANAERLSMCGRVATRLANLCLTQWEHLSRPAGPRYSGSIL